MKIKLTKPRRASNHRNKKNKPGSVTRRAKGGRGGKIIGGVFLSIFLLVGLGFGYFMFGRPILRVIDAKDWPSVPCVVTSSQVHESSDSDGSTYRIKITFHYNVNGRPHTSDRYDFFSFIGSPGRSGKQKIIDQYPVGSQATCFVNPSDPTMAVIHRGWSKTLWFGLIPLVFVLVGGGGLVGMFWGGAKRSWATGSASRADEDASKNDDWLPAIARRAERDTGVSGRLHATSETVSPTKSRLTGLIVITVFALFWNGIVSVFLVDAFNGSASWFAGIFMIPFVLVGIGLVLGVLYMLLALSNPKVQMTFDPRVVEAGTTLRVNWTIDGRAGRIQKMTVTVEGLERASYTRGTDTITDEHVFFEHTLYEAQAMDPRDPMAREVSATLDLPLNTMHSLDAPNNKILWRIKVHGDIPRWPDVKDEYEFAVVPATAGPNRRGMF